MVNILWTRASFWSRVVVYVLLIAAAVFTIIPFVWSAINSVKTLTETFQLGAFIPFLQFQPTLDSWREVLSDPQTENAFISSCAISAGTTVFALVLGVPAAYALARYEFPVRSNDIALWFLSQRVLPPAVVLIPFYLLLVYLRLIDTWTGLILAYSAFNLAFVVVIMRDIFRDVSTEIEDAAKVEGADALADFLDDCAAVVARRTRSVVGAGFRLHLERGSVRVRVDVAGGYSFLGARARLALDPRRRLQHGRGQHPDRHHSAGNFLPCRPALSCARPVLRRRQGIAFRDSAIAAAVLKAELRADDGRSWRNLTVAPETARELIAAVPFRTVPNSDAP